MKKSELKNIIKECVKEVIFEEGVLSGIIAEVAQGLQGPALLEQRRASNPPASAQISETKRQVLSAIGGDAYADIKKKFQNPQLFEGTEPIQDTNEKSALSGITPSDPGLDISNIPGFGTWGNIADMRRK